MPSGMPPLCVPQPTMPRIFVVVACGGTGSRAGAGVPKQYRHLEGDTVLGHTTRAVAAVPAIKTIVIAVSADTLHWDAAQAAASLDSRCKLVPCAGLSRADTVRNGLSYLLANGGMASDWVLVHDAARCLVTPQQVINLIDACRDDAVGGLLAVPLPDTLKQEGAGRAVATLPRGDKWLAQTPQMFRLGALHDALLAAESAGATVTDEASAMEYVGLSPKLVAGSAENFKLTYPADFELASAVLVARQASARHASVERVVAPGFDLRVGEGWDVHALVPGRKLIIGGVHIPHSVGLLGHSDADVLLHAITDAVLGAAGLGDIGQHFPDTDARFAGADSSVLLAHAMQCAREMGFRLLNVDCTVVAQAPKLAAHRPLMCERIAKVLGLAVAQVNVKAKTAEKLGPVGQGLSIEARAVVLLFR
jgi:2-C-methyl-D-erythritol 4-phosphate cytidylyltransferase / 2-C-methyl-D-erythritol 2,4-cyclodiphosphate synthase